MSGRISKDGKFHYSHDYCMGWFASQAEKDTLGICMEHCGSDECVRITNLYDCDGQVTSSGQAILDAEAQTGK